MTAFTDQKPEIPQNTYWPQWVEDARLSDDLAAQSYEETPPQWRAAIKTGLALAHMHFGSSSDQLREQRSNRHLGFWQRSESSAAPWAIIAFTPAYAAAARLAAACIPAILAGVPLIGAVCVGGQPHRSTLVSLELSGVEDIFVLDSSKLQALLEESSGPGRLVLLHTGELSQIADFAHAVGLPCWQESRTPRLALAEGDSLNDGQGLSAEDDYLDLEALYFAQAEALDSAISIAPGTLATGPQEVGITAANTSPLADALYLASTTGQAANLPQSEFFSQNGPELVLTPGCEGFWLHPGLTPDFFRVRRLAFGTL